MGNTIEIANPVFGGGSSGLISVAVTITDYQGNPLSDRIFTFSAMNYSSIVDSDNADLASCRFGQYSLEVTSGTYSVFEFGGSPVANAYELINLLSSEIVAL